MKSSSFFLVLLLVSTAAIFGCKSPTSVVSGAPYVTITPSNLRQAEFVVDTFQARIFNHDFAQTYFGWSFGDSTVINPYQRPGENFVGEHIYTKPGNYIVTVNAFDIYSNNIIATTTTSVTIDTAKSSVEIIPQFYSGVLPMNNFGLTPFVLSVKTLIPDVDLYQFWDYGDGTTDSFLSGPTTHIFPHPGSYLLKVDLYQKSGVYVGTDTAAITINWPTISLDSLKKMARVEVYFNIDSTFPLFNSTHNYLPLSLGELFVGGNSTSSWNGNDFSVEFKSGYPHDYIITGTITNDIKNISSLSISASGSNPNFNYSLNVHNLELMVITSDKIVFKIVGNSLTSSLQNFSFVADGTSIFDVANAGYLVDQWRSFINGSNQKIVPFCILVFSKQ